MPKDSPSAPKGLMAKSLHHILVEEKFLLRKALYHFASENLDSDLVDAMLPASACVDVGSSGSGSGRGNFERLGAS